MMRDWAGVRRLADEFMAEMEGAWAAERIRADELRIYRGLVYGPMAMVMVGEGDLAGAAPLYQKFIEFSQEIGRRDWVGWALIGQGFVLLQPWSGRDVKAATAHLREGLAMNLDLGDTEAALGCMLGLAQVAQEHGDWARAAQVLGATEGLRQRLGLDLIRGWRAGIDFGMLWHWQHEERAPTVRTALGEKAFATAWAAGEAMALEQAVECALAVE